MVIFIFVGVVVSYCFGLYIVVSMVIDWFLEMGKKICFILVDLLMILISLFILVYSYILCSEFWL